MKALLNKDLPSEGPSEFISHRGNTVTLGNSKSAQSIPMFEYQRNDFLRHHEGPAPVPANMGTLLPAKSIYAPNRRSKESMSNPRADENSAYAEVAELRREKSAMLRTQEMVDRSHRTGFNVITGDIYGNGPRPERLHSRHIPDGLGPESHNRGIQQLKDSCNRYFIPQESGGKHERRQDTLMREGISKPKMQGVISVGKAEAPSYGIEDQFSKSKYLNTNIKGLVETNQAGKYTPRKCPTNNPSANPSIRSKWTTGVVLSTKY
mmetsp:Transcript_21116/g.35594  ORF Transcript_21116/g.35594 Transcript_21116/m.35594 type:complete len:264 (+) Transcript_21116:178-969(+)